MIDHHEKEFGIVQDQIIVAVIQVKVTQVPVTSHVQVLSIVNKSEIKGIIDELAVDHVLSVIHI